MLRQQVRLRSSARGEVGRVLGRWPAASTAACLTCLRPGDHRPSFTPSIPLPKQPSVANVASGRRCNGPIVCQASSSAAGAQPQSHSLGSALYALYKFGRPHTMAGTIVSILSMSALALQTHGGWELPGAWLGLMQALTSALLMNVAIVGINQLHDVEIDKVNKPYLPLASGELSMAQGTAIVWASTVLALVIGVASGSPALVATLVVSWVLGLLYSVQLPFMRWKRSPVLAAGCILAVRAIAVQLGFYFHMQSTLLRAQLASLAATAAPSAVAAAAKAAASASAAPGSASLGSLSSWFGLGTLGLGGLGLGSLQLTPAISFTLCFMLLFSVVIALFKDIPDTLGDKRAGIRTLTVRLGVPRVFWTCIWILTAAYGGAILYSVLAAHFATTSSTLPLTSSLSSWFQATPSTLAAAQAAAGHSSSGVMPASLSLLGAMGGTLGIRTVACVAGHCVMAALLWQRALRTDLSSNKDIYGCYMYVWKLFYAEYILIPLLL